MKKFTILSKAGYKLMTDGVQEFDGAVVEAMDKIHLWDQLAQSYMKEINGIKFFISVGYNARYFKADGQKYCTHLHIATTNGCYLHSCLCSWRQSEIENDIIRFIDQVDQFESHLINDKSFNFEAQFQEALKSYPWQTSTPKN